MDFELEALDSESPVVVTIDPENGIYTIRKSDTSGEVFNTAEELHAWYKTHLNPMLFSSQTEYAQGLAWMENIIAREL
ncbi:hypothetical protein D3H55_21630 [Bacillus salacetis]|uniref:Threonine dehydratase n=1 Tax=Bacillus salacetis TaxID=2315464 RepID=A0A3A1QQD4_9BACI|nr:hypothetical protein [Bacillus salacetis]RIW28492.1 hypothetical protein D3H55_21630 [Bacillus salacetis]